MNDHSSSLGMKMKVGFFSLGLLVITGFVTMWVNDRPQWWKTCQLVFINIDDATGLKTKSPIRSLGLQIGFLRSVELTETYVRLGICITADVDLLSSTRAYIRGEGFLGDKFVELKPVRSRVKKAEGGGGGVKPAPAASPVPSVTSSLNSGASSRSWWPSLSLIPSAVAQESTMTGTDVPVGEKNSDMSAVVEKVDGLVNQLNGLTTNLKKSFDPVEFNRALTQLNKTLENASRSFSPAEGSLTSTAQRALAKMEDAIEQLRDLLTRVNQGKGSLGILMNDPSYAEEIREAIRNINRMLGKFSGMRLNIDFGGEYIPAYTTAARAYFSVGIYPTSDRYYLVGVAADPRGDVISSTVTTTVGGTSTTVQTTDVSTGRPVLTLMLGKIFFNRLEFAAGLKFGDAAGTIALHLGPRDNEERLKLINDLYSHSDGVQLGSRFHDRVTLQWFPFGSPYLKTVYIKGAVETFRTSTGGAFSWSVGGGVSFDDQDVKVLFSFL